MVSDSSRWSTNGSPAYGSYGVNFSGSSGGSLISIPAITGANSNDYEVTSTLAINGGGGTYIHFLRTSGGTVQAGSGSYVSVELVIPSGFTSPGTATLNVNKCASGTVTLLGSVSITATNGMTLRIVVFGGSLWVFTTNNTWIYAGSVPVTTGNPGIGGYGIPAGSGFSGIWLGHHDVVSPGQVVGTSAVSSVFPNSASLRWAGVLDDPIGTGLFVYNIWRNGVFVANTTQPEFVDNTVAPGTAYTYSVYVYDYHGNYSAPTTITVATPPANAVDPRRTGIYTTGSYRGGGGEQIDTLSGNLNFSLPLLTAVGRAGTNIPVGLVYNSQNWRQDSGVNWKLGNDVGYGFGWQMLIGSITPYYTPSDVVDHYVYTDSTGAQYLLNVNTSGVWSSKQSVYVWFDSNANKLHFRDGSFWVMGCTSGGTEADAGTMYPTILEDVSGNQITVTYRAGAGLTAANTSARIIGIYDGRAASGGASYSFSYNTDTPIPHLSGTTDYIGTGVSYSFAYNESVAVEPPFGTDPSFAGVTTTQLASMTNPTANPWQFTYDSAGASELLKATFPWGGHLRWSYGTDPYSGSRDLRAVSARYLAADSAGATEWSYGIARDNAASSGAIVHGTMTLSDASGVGAKTWNFLNTSSYPAWQIGLASSFVQSASAGGTVLQDDVYTWSQDPAGNPYISTKASTTGQGTSNVETATGTQTLDQYGNVTQSVAYPYNNTTTPLKTFTNTYLNSSTYTSNYIFNRLVSSSVTPAGGSATTLVTNTYDTTTNCTTSVSSTPPTQCQGWASPTSAPVYNVDPSPPIPVGQRGYLNLSVTPAKSTTIAVYTYGSPAVSWGSDGTVSSAIANPSTDFNAPVTITSQSYTTTLAYNSWLGVTQSTGSNGEQMSMTYDSYGRPSSGTSPYCVSGCSGPTVSYSYGTSAPFTQTTTGPDGVTTTTLDGLGRAILVARGDTSGVHSYTATTYAPYGGSPLGKIQKTSQPYPYGSSASAWTTNTYDGLGRSLTVQQPDGASTTSYAYSGNVTTVTDPAGKWKQFTTDISGNLTAVVEPDPANPPSGTLTTSYTYDWMNHVTLVTMTRGSTTQTRTFNYDTAGRLTSAINPESGTVTYTYNSDNTLYDKLDSKGQDTIYSYDSQKRLIYVQRFPNGHYYAEDLCQRETYYYDTNPYIPGFSLNSFGRLTVAAYGPTNAWNYSCIPGVWGTLYAEMYSYHPAGAVATKRLQTMRQGIWSDLDVIYGYDSAGRTSTVTYPMAAPFGSGSYPAGATTFTYAFDSMGRPAGLTDGNSWAWAKNAQYDYAGRPTSEQYLVGPGKWTTRSLGYNVNSQLASMQWSVAGPVLGMIQYGYSATQNNGQITQAVDNVSGETIAYQYDALRRLTSAASTPNAGTTPTAWTQTFQYDGFGNLMAKVLNGSTTPIPVNAATNQLSSAYYDANGNMTSGAGATLVYDVANRISSATEVSGGTEYYYYSPDNKRIYRLKADGITEEWTFYGARGERLGVYSLGASGGFTPLRTNVAFAGTLILDTNSAAFNDRTGSNRASGGRFYPYGDEITSTANDREKFGTYLRDGFTGLDYADQRYYASTYGRFNSADQYVASAQGANNPNDPGTWNRYAYVAGDPINRVDPTGRDYTLLCWDGDSDACGGIGDGWGWRLWGDYSGCGNQDPLSPFSFTRVCEQPDQGGQLGGGGGGGSVPPAPCTISTGAAGTGPIKQTFVGTFPWSPPSDTLGGYTTVGLPGYTNLFNQGWYFAEQLQGTLIADTNPLDWLALQSISWSGTIQYTVDGQRGVLSGPLSGALPDDDPAAEATYQATGIFDWIDAPGLGLLTKNGVGTVVGANVNYSVTSKLSPIGGGAGCSVSWGFNVTIPYNSGGIRPIKPKTPGLPR